MGLEAQRRSLVILVMVSGKKEPWRHQPFPLGRVGRDLADLESHLLFGRKGDQ